MNTQDRAIWKREKEALCRDIEYARRQCADQRETTMNAQDLVAGAVKARGYYQRPDGTYWTREQLAARQVAKLTEELGELMDAIWAVGQGNGPARWEDLLYEATIGAKLAFDKGAWEHAEVTDHDAAASELADLQVVLFTLADALGVDVVQAAITKAERDVTRGIRGVR